MTGHIFDIKRYATHDGPGIRTTVFFSGCPLSCWWCHNPEALVPQPVDTGRRWVGSVRADEVLGEIERDTVYYDQSGGGATFSGGEPLVQAEFLEALLTGCRERSIHTAVDTTGHAPSDVIERLAPHIDLFLYDLKLMDPDTHRKYTGATHKDTLGNLKHLDERQANLILRLPLVPGITATAENVDSTIDFLLSGVSYRRITLLPYHQTAEAKYQRLGLENKMAGVEPMSSGEVAAIRDVFEERGFDVTVGG